MALQKFEPGTSLANQVFDAIHEGIMKGDLPAGYRLRIRDLAEELGTSVMPVREAINRLEEAGLAEKVPYKGAVVKGLSLEELLDVYDVRRLLEVEAARLGAARVSTADVDRMRQHYRAMCQALEEGRVVTLLDHDEELLSILYAASGNRVIVDTIRTLWRRCRPYKIVGARNTLEAGDPAILSAFQERLIEAVAGQDADAAADINNQSLVSATDRIRDALLRSESSHSRVDGAASPAHVR
ncbi:GntR family transcriptional regulator [Tersicoccus sp. Bi-70]|uniref:GntR family transcriptional regulator n=1 Tax=Tersicoccus sp. Bi-70 TaxID=1897634 RepID=UPI000977D44F|nr:GntR family transcriptional regulator [Tersicoccus sp. Bi-70]OMH34226.1 GntR family transcriptional regulator [Tersicoccus sp. Bi-70]